MNGASWKRVRGGALIVSMGWVLAGCAMTGTTIVLPTVPGAPAAPNVASVPMPLAELFGYATEALTSRASLVRSDDAETCFDVVLRRPLPTRNSVSLPLWYSVEVDGVEMSRVARALAACGQEAPCLPPDSYLLPFTPEIDPKIRVEASRFCFEGLPRARHELAFNVNPDAGAWRFRFLLDDEARWMATPSGT